MLKRIFILVIVLIALLLAYATTRPATFRVERSATIQAPPDKVFATIDDFHNWSAWSPWAKLDPAMKETYSGASSGKGAIYEWEGNNKVGQGRMEITDSNSPTSDIIKLDFLKPFEAHNTTVFTLQSSGAGTTVIWTMSGPNTYMGKVMGIFVNMDKMIGKDFETGLANLKAITEK